MTDDCLRLILQHVCEMKVRRNAKSLHAEVCNIPDAKFSGRPILSGAGFLGVKETIMLRDSVTFFPYADPCLRPMWKSQMPIVSENGQWRKPTKHYDLVLSDPVGDEYSMYDDLRDEDGLDESFNACLGWGWRKEVAYSVRLSRDISVKVTFDVIVVPTSWWIDDCEGDWWTIQMVDAQRALPSKLELDARVSYNGYEVAGWTKKDDN